MYRPAELKYIKNIKRVIYELENTNNLFNNIVKDIKGIIIKQIIYSFMENHPLLSLNKINYFSDLSIKTNKQEKIYENVKLIKNVCDDKELYIYMWERYVSKTLPININYIKKYLQNAAESHPKDIRRNYIKEINKNYEIIYDHIKTQQNYVATSNEQIKTLLSQGFLIKLADLCNTLYYLDDENIYMFIKKCLYLKSDRVWMWEWLMLNKKYKVIKMCLINKCYDHKLLNIFIKHDQNLLLRMYKKLKFYIYPKKLISSAMINNNIEIFNTVMESYPPNKIINLVKLNYENKYDDEYEYRIKIIKFVVKNKIMDKTNIKSIVNLKYINKHIIQHVDLKMFKAKYLKLIINNFDIDYDVNLIFAMVKLGLVDEINNLFKNNLFKNNLDIMFDSNDESILHIAAKYKYPDIKNLTNICLNLGLDINWINNEGNTILHVARSHFPENIEFFISKGANPNILNFKGL